MVRAPFDTRFARLREALLEDGASLSLSQAALAPMVGEGVLTSA